MKTTAFQTRFLRSICDQIHFHSRNPEPRLDLTQKKMKKKYFKIKNNIETKTAKLIFL